MREAAEQNEQRAFQNLGLAVKKACSPFTVLVLDMTRERQLDDLVE